MVNFPNSVRFSDIENLEVIDEISMTEPNQSIKIKDLFSRFESGNLADIGKQIQYGDDQTFDDAFDNNMSVFDAYELNRQYEEKMNLFIQQKQEENRKAEEQKLYEELRKKFEAASPPQEV